MSNQAEKVWVGNIIREDLPDLAEREVNIPLGVVDSTYETTHDAEQERLRATLGGLLELAGIDTSDWQGQIKAASRKTWRKETMHPNDVRRWARGQSLGQFVLDRSWWVVPIENGQEGEDEGAFSITLGLVDNVDVTVASVGTYSVSRIYVDPETGEQVTGDLDELEDRAMNAELNTDIAAIYTRISYEAQFHRPEATEA